MNGHQDLSLDQAKVFARELGVEVDEMLRRSGLAEGPVAQAFKPGFSDSDAAVWVPGDAADGGKTRSVADALGATRPGVDVWRIKSQAMALAGFLHGDFVLVDTHQAERIQPNDIVIAQIYNNNFGTAVTVLRRYQPPVLTAASMNAEDIRVHVVDGVNVVVRGKVIASWRI